MIITCNKCSTRFNLDNFLVKANGSKCCCSVCKHIFMVYPLPEKQDIKSDKSSELNLESQNPDFEPKDNDSSIDHNCDIENELGKSMQQTSTNLRRKKKSPVRTFFLILLLICLLVVGAYIAGIMTGYKIPYISDIKIPFIEQYLEKSAPKILNIKPSLNQKSVNGIFITNSTAGTLFVITGKIENPSNIAYSHIQIKGTLMTEDNKEAKTKNAYCGNIIPENMLKTGDIDQINKIISTKAGADNFNDNVKPKTSIPFMIVFSDLPDKLQNFTVKVIGFKKNQLHNIVIETPKEK